MDISFGEVLKVNPLNKELNKALAEAFLSSIDQNAISQLTTRPQITVSMMKSSPQNHQKTLSQVYSKRLCYARKIAEINKKRDSNAKDLDSESVYMYISHYLDIPGGPLPSYLPEDYYSNDGLMSAWITNYDRNVYETYLSFEMREKAKKKSFSINWEAEASFFHR